MSHLSNKDFSLLAALPAADGAPVVVAMDKKRRAASLERQGLVQLRLADGRSLYRRTAAGDLAVRLVHEEDSRESDR